MFNLEFFLFGFVLQTFVSCKKRQYYLSIVESQSTISIEPIGFSMSLGYAV